MINLVLKNTGETKKQAAFEKFIDDALSPQMKFNLNEAILSKENRRLKQDIAEMQLDNIEKAREIKELRERVNSLLRELMEKGHKPLSG